MNSKTISASTIIVILSSEITNTSSDSSTPVVYASKTLISNLSTSIISIKFETS